MSTEYVSPDGATQFTDDPVVEVRLRTHGWRPRPELESAAEHNKAAAERLERARAADAEAKQRVEERKARIHGRSAESGPPQGRPSRPDQPDRPNTPPRRRTRAADTDTE
ncbi:hypothetical protein [Nocardiopsis sp. YSL2]|uniref:hypothetical protein n=1 Tax=Nocardiopsis sp. YSL2 TaxID=2939492 RepID=UPI0026F4125E|nr:hypothetical protein [Nocardiopsis sp. YSL2]